MAIFNSYVTNYQRVLDKSASLQNTPLGSVFSNTCQDDIKSSAKLSTLLIFGMSTVKVLRGSNPGQIEKATRSERLIKRKDTYYPETSDQMTNSP